MERLYESAHANNIERLIKEFGSKNGDHIRRLYGDERAVLEKEANIKDFLPIFAYRIVRQVLRAEFEKGYAEKKARHTQQ